MKKVIVLLSLVSVLTVGIFMISKAQSDATSTPQTNQTVSQSTLAAPVAAEKSFHYVLKEKFIEGGAGWMAPILICLIGGLALVIERIVYLNLSTVNTQKLLNKVETAIQTKGVAAAKDVCKNTKGPVASVFYQGLDRVSEGLDIVEKSVISYGGVVMARLENNLSWITLFIALAPMLGFLGTVVGMVQAFADIEAAGDISPTIVAAGMKVALLTTVFGLITAIILQVFYNYLLSKVDNLVNSMEDATISFMDILVKNKNAKQ